LKTSIIGYPRVGTLRELKFASEKYFKGEIELDALHKTAAELRAAHWRIQQEHGIDYIPSNDFSFYDGLLDTACLFNIIPERYRDLGLRPLETYFAMARGYQGEQGDVKALAMNKWFNTNYHYMVPEIDDSTKLQLTGTKLFDEYLEAAREHHIETTPVLIGPFTLLKLAKYTGVKQAGDFVNEAAAAYVEVLKQLNGLRTEWIQLDEPELVTDLSPADIALFTKLYSLILPSKANVKVLVQTYFGDIRDCYQELQALPFDGIGIDFIEGTRSLELINRYGFSANKVLFAGIVNGKNIWKNPYKSTLELINEISKKVQHMVINTSCSLLHVPYSLQHETNLTDEYKRFFSFAEEKLQELSELKAIIDHTNPYSSELYIDNVALFKSPRYTTNEAVQARSAALTESDFVRLPVFTERAVIQKSKFGLPQLPTTTIGSFPQTAEVRANRFSFKKGNISEEQYKQFNFDKIAQCIKLQEEIGLDVLVHGEYERNDMVEYFGECLDGYMFTEKAWVQSYGTRCVKPPIVWGDISRSKPMTVEYSVYAKSLTSKPVKGMLTGPVTILNWSFPREDISLRDSAVQIALAIRDEVLDLESNQIEIIQIDEAALREKLPLRQSDWQSDYLSWAIPAFRLVHSGVKAATQIHTHMCYSQFSDIISDIDAMDADVITFEASRSDLAIIDAINQCGFQTEVGPGVYDIHSPRIPSVDELKQGLHRILEKIDVEKLWVNPDCGLKTRGEAETLTSLKHLVQAAKEVREAL
jgi:5-methyltetrahydropteroyltriglutamate--homocysteine methyltransferase